ncbi:unnamed protein product, partial [Mesorhabditis belari]|uniref:Uncharacterized protein n=1 Tax=Mesorhabditis belari TaxID=2138241 RepID=A0AAF3FMW1_9BILA
MLSPKYFGAAVNRRDTAVLSQVNNVFKDNCRAKSGGGCSCDIKWGDSVEQRDFYSDTDCKKSVEQQTVDNKKALNKEIQQKFGGFKDNCFPKPSGGCKCEVNLGRTGDAPQVIEYHNEADCKKSIEAETAENKKDVNEEIKQKYGDFKENCFPKPSGGCKCNEKDASGADVVASYSTDAQCKELVPRNKEKREAREDTRTQSQFQVNVRQQKDSDSPSQNVRDPVRDQAQANYRAVVNELNEKFKGLREGCYPRPKGCLCVTGKDRSGNDITRRFMKDTECKCTAGSPGCPV